MATLAVFSGDGSVSSKTSSVDTLKSEIPSFTIQDMLGSLGITPGSSSNILPPPSTLEYLFDDEYVKQGPSFGSRLAYGTGITYFSGLGFGGLWGLAEGTLHPDAKTARLRWNCILNACTRRGPFVGNHLGLIALFYNFIHGGLLKATNRQADLASTTSSAVLAGLIFRAPKGPKASVVAGVVTGSVMAAFDTLRNYQEYKFYIKEKLESSQ